MASWPPAGVDFGCEYCADEQTFHYGHLSQIGSDEKRCRILLQCPRCSALYENSPAGPDAIQRLTERQAAEMFPERTEPA
jgi:hypothetical protein